MIHLPVLEHLEISDYALYPGTDESPGLHVTFARGLTLVLGANGLGKTTLITIIFRLLTGPYDIQNTPGALGTRRIESTKLPNSETRAFAARVVDGGKGSTATLTYSLGGDRFTVARELSSLQLVSATKNGAPIATTEEALQSALLASAGFGRFGEWILALRLLVFYFEDRRALVWDKSAQVQVLRLLFLGPEASSSWSDSFREVVELDSLVRNLNWVINREERLVVKKEVAIGRLPEVRQQLSLLTEIQGQEQATLTELDESLVTLTGERNEARLNDLRAEQALETANRSLEKLELQALHDSFPKSTQTFRYIAAQILTEEVCLTCSSTVPAYAAQMKERLHEGACPVCASQFEVSSVAPILQADFDHARREVDDAAHRHKVASNQRALAEGQYDDLLERLAELTASTSGRDREIGQLLKRLPPDQTSIHERRHGLNADKSRLANHRERLVRLRSDFDAIQVGVNRIISERAAEVMSAFDTYASGFLLENCMLTWGTFKDRLGEGGALTDFPAFELDMSGAGFTSPVRRSGPESVSESQREFIDLSFRMALMDVATNGAGTLIIDAPESSLDAVFVGRASEVLTRFAASRGNKRLVVTSNIIDGDLIPDLLAGSRITTPEDGRVVDLLSIAAPTAGTSQRHEEYLAVRKRIFAKAEAKVNA